MEIIATLSAYKSARTKYLRDKKEKQVENDAEKWFRSLIQLFIGI